ncbi:MAG: tRNA pseudouridine(54/55) synthase Pus10 [Thermoplasmata archaeon]|jgi:tRNA pseudouridine synthase 10
MQYPEEINELCDSCLGRIYAMMGHGLTNKERGRAIRILYSMENNLNIGELKIEKCYICNNIFNDLEKYAEIVIDEMKNYEFNTFLVGIRIDDNVLEKEKKIHEKYGNMGESIKNELSREIGKIISNRMNKNVDLKDPELSAIIDVDYYSVEIKAKSIYIYGRYRKYSRNIPQTRWIHNKGDKSVEERIGEIAIKYFKGNKFYLHGAGREDVDVLMLGNGRPFILEITNPKIRNYDLREIEKEVNEKNKGIIEIFDLRYSSSKEVEEIKSKEYPKVYELEIELEKEIPNEEIVKKLKSLENVIIDQRTPLRVIKSRSDMHRKKRIRRIEIKNVEDKKIILEIETDPGTYVKEFVHGDNGRTNPSISSILDQKIKIIRLDVVKILEPEER